ncbi:hypothetical protein H2204_004282 [Knufia peltigerae]|uniref:Major facilitator superfamily (MFS) profile domain-containing protein n=1 Tax=Knufia peltigerae TaxID=1002370 RepID=A0AA38Y973_9EURO|nr:hypothetical protein H2204_004282 [Knufia peltigerae]
MVSEEKNLESQPFEHTESSSPVPVAVTTTLNDNQDNTNYKGPLFVGSIAGATLGLVAGTASFGFQASLLAVINDDLGPSDNYYWLSLVFTLTLAVCCTLIGRVTDLFGRRYFVVGSYAVATVGSLVASRAGSIDTLIGANVLMGVGAVAQQSHGFVVGELVPQKHRVLAVNLMYAATLPTTAFAPAVAWAWVLHTKAGWRWCFYFTIILNAISCALMLLFYHPPTFHMKSNRNRGEVIRHFDWIGLALFSGGLITFLLGLSWGGSAYPWKSARVIATLVVGGATLIIFVIFECMAPLQVPLIPMRLFRKTGFVANVLSLSLCASCYYAFQILWPQIVSGIYTTDKSYASVLYCASSASYTLGILAASLSRYIGRQKWQVVTVSTIATALLGGLACLTTDNKSTMLGLLIPGLTLIAYAEGVGGATTSLTIDDQAEIGTAVGVALSMRSLISTVALTIYLTVLQNRLKHTVPEEVVPVLLKAGLPESSISLFIGAITSGSFSKVPGATAQIVQAGIVAYRRALVLAFRSVLYTVLAFLLLNILVSLLFPNLDHMMNDSVAARLHDPRNPDTPRAKPSTDHGTITREENAAH